MEQKEGEDSFLSFLPRRGIASDAEIDPMINFQSRLNYAGRLSPIEEASPDSERAVCVVQKKKKKEEKRRSREDRERKREERKREKMREIERPHPSRPYSHRIKGSSFSLEEDCVQG